MTTPAPTPVRSAIEIWMTEPDQYDTLTSAELRSLDRYLARQIRDQLAILAALDGGLTAAYITGGMVDLYWSNTPSARRREEEILEHHRARRRALRPYRGQSGTIYAHADRPGTGPDCALYPAPPEE